MSLLQLNFHIEKDKEFPANMNLNTQISFLVSWKQKVAKMKKEKQENSTMTTSKS